MSPNQLIIFMTSNYNCTYIKHITSAQQYIVHMYCTSEKSTPFNKYQKTCLTLCVKVITNFCRWVPNCHPCSSSLQTDNKPCYELFSSAISFRITWNQISRTLFTIPTYQNRIICTFIFHCANHVHNPILFSIHNNMHLLSTDSHSD